MPGSSKIINTVKTVLNSFGWKTIACRQRITTARENPNMIRIEREAFYTEAGIVRSMTGPVYSIASFMGGMAMKDKGNLWQVLGCIVGSIAIFLPSALLVLFFFPIWHNLQRYVIVYRALEGINAVVVGIMVTGNRAGSDDRRSRSVIK